MANTLYDLLYFYNGWHTEAEWEEFEKRCAAFEAARLADAEALHKIGGLKMWEPVETTSAMSVTYRLPVPGGWIYRITGYREVTAVFVPKTARDLEAAYEEGFEDGKQTMRELLNETEKVKPATDVARFDPDTPPDIAYSRGYNDGQREALKKED